MMRSCEGGRKDTAFLRGRAGKLGMGIDVRNFSG
jgi:hypothetical protein